MGTYATNRTPCSNLSLGHYSCSLEVNPLHGLILQKPQKPLQSYSSNYGGPYARKEGQVGATNQVRRYGETAEISAVTADADMLKSEDMQQEAIEVGRGRSFRGVSGQVR